MSTPENLINRWRERHVQVALFVFAALFFLMGRTYQVSDSLFTVLLGHSILQQQSLNLKPYLDEPDFRAQGLPTVDGIQISRHEVGTAHERWVTNYPQMPVYLSLPLIAITDQFYPVIHGSPPQFDLDNEIRQQLIIAAILCALYTLLMYRVARLWLDRPMALLAVAVLMVGSSVTSILSRAVWSDTWANVLILLAMHHLAHAHRRQTPLKVYYWVPLMALAFFCKPLYAFPILGLIVWAWQIDRRQVNVLGLLGALFVAGYILLAWQLYGAPIAPQYLAHAHRRQTPLKVYYWVPLMALAFFCKPLYAFPILGLIVWAWQIDRRQVNVLCLLGALFVAGYILLAWQLYGAPIAPQYLAAIHGFSAPRAVAFFGVLISPSRGIFVFWPWLIFMMAVAPLAWRHLRAEDKTLLWLTLAMGASLTVLLGCFQYWFGGVGYGPRLMTPILPWVSLCAIILFRGWLDDWHGLSLAVQQKKQALPALGLLCLMVAFYINIYGMMQPRSFYQWYNLPAEKDRATEDRLWDWGDPVWLAGIVGRERYTLVSPY